MTKHLKSKKIQDELQHIFTQTPITLNKFIKPFLSILFHLNLNMLLLQNSINIIILYNRLSKCLFGELWQCQECLASPLMLEPLCCFQKFLLVGFGSAILFVDFNALSNWRKLRIGVSWRLATSLPTGLWSLHLSQSMLSSNFADLFHCQECLVHDRGPGGLLFSTPAWLPPLLPCSTTLNAWGTSTGTLIRLAALHVFVCPHPSCDVYMDSTFHLLHQSFLFICTSRHLRWPLELVLQ